MIDRKRARESAGKGKPIRRALRALAGAAAIVAASFASGAAFGAPAILANDSDITAFAQRVKAFAGASRVRWVVAATTKADAEALVANIGLHLLPDDRTLLARVKAQTFAENPEVAPGASIPIAWMIPQAGLAQGGPACSWQVLVSDPSFPSLAAAGVSVPLAPNDKLPVGADATFRVGYTGLLQSKLYAFDETQPGAIRDLASAPDVNIPVAIGPGGETILLAMARHPAPFLEGIRTALATSAGQRRDLGKEYALRENLLGKGRGIGANIQLVTPNMVVAKDETGRQPKPNVVARADDPHAGELMETCIFSLTRAQSAAP
ncbi:hypothetical protein [Methylocapsa sp. S129]|uniref:hypothetical protein n=1 Tax=Methylocapsa sp. S129 TaxID=1641869 RepID=UPI00131AB7AF|nr:hypothetical protein [Methylocapsa sp. S129]